MKRSYFKIVLNGYKVINKDYRLIIQIFNPIGQRLKYAYLFPTSSRWKNLNTLKDEN